MSSGAAGEAAAEAVKVVGFTYDTVLPWLAAWQCVSMCSRWVFQKFAHRMVSVNVEAKKREQYIAELRNIGPSYVTTTLCALLTGWRGVTYFLAMLDAPDAVKMTCGVSITAQAGIDPTWAPVCSDIALTNVMFGSLLLQDMVQVIYRFPKAGGWDQVVHHSVFLVCCFVNGGYRISFFPFCWLILGELSTVLLELRWFLIKFGMGASALLALVNYGFALAFGVTRVVVYGWGLYKMLLASGLLYDTEAPAVLVSATLFMVVAGYCLNLFWFRQIVVMALGGAKGKRRNARSMPVKKD